MGCNVALTCCYSDAELHSEFKTKARRSSGNKTEYTQHFYRQLGYMCVLDVNVMKDTLAFAHTQVCIFLSVEKPEISFSAYSLTDNTVCVCVGGFNVNLMCVCV